MKKILPYILFILCIATTVVSIYLPKEISDRSDYGILGKIQTQAGLFFSGGYRYSMTEDEKLYILAKALDNRSFAQSDYAAYVRSESTRRDSDQTYTYVANVHGAADNEIGREAVIGAINAQIAELYENNVFASIEVNENDYNIELYSAIDILDPQSNICVWQISNNQPLQQLGKNNVLMEAYMDAQTGKLYCFSYRTATPPDFYKGDEIITNWCAYIGIENCEPYDNNNPLAEMTPNFKKYTIGKTDAGRTLVTIGFYEGINEVFLKIE